MRFSRRDFIRLCFAAAAAGSFFKSPAPARGDGRKAFEPHYVRLHKSGELKRRGEELWALMERCCLCPRMCGARRIAGEAGFCRASAALEVSSFHQHFGEEPELVGRGGSGTIFFTNCSLRCVFCINWETSHEGRGSVVSADDLAGMMLRLQSLGCENINLVTPTHYLAHILLALDKAAEGGLRLPLVYNTCGWERIEMLRMLDGAVDVYLPDFKYISDEMSVKYSSGAAGYPEATKAALLEMHRQVGSARPDSDGITRRGLMVRHLVMPNNVGGTGGVLMWISGNLPKDTYVNLMPQYRPLYKAFDYPEIARGITAEEYKDAARLAAEAGLTNVRLQS